MNKEVYENTIRIQFEMINELTEKIDKAIEYIKMYCPMLDNETQPIWNKILEILGDKE